MLTNRFTPLIIERQEMPDISGNPGKPARSGSAYSTVSGTWRGFIQPRKGGETFREQKGGTEVSFVLYSDVATPAVYGDKITQSGQSYIVMSPIQPEGISSVDHHKEIDLEVFE